MFGGSCFSAMRKKLLFILNPKAGLRKANRFLSDMISLFTKSGYECTVFTTDNPGDGAAIVEEYASASDLIVCAGGDGTLNEVITGTINSGLMTPIGYIPAGSTNDFGASIGLSSDIMTAARDIMLGSPRLYDVGSFNGRYFSYVASVGAFTKASYSTPQEVKNAIGHLAYILEGIKEIPSIQPVHLRVETEDACFEDNYIFGAVSNSTSIAGIMTLDPSRVSMDDGLFEIMLIKSPSTAAQLSRIIYSITNQDYDPELITFCAASQARIFAPETADWTLDGEFAKGVSEIEVKNIHHAIRLVINK